jgi:nicotinate phosphoribosyltransferase
MRGIRSKWSTDGYKATMGFIFRFLNVVLGKRILGRWIFKDRDDTQYPKGHAEKLNERLGEYTTLSPEPQIEEYIGQRWPWLNRGFLQWFGNVFTHDLSQVDIQQNAGSLNITVEGPIHTATHWEIPILQENTELINEELGNTPKPGWQTQHESDARFLFDENIGYADGGGRRAFSRAHHYDALAIYSKYRKSEGHGGLSGTSFLNYAYDFNLMAMGTMGHEFPELMAGIYGYEDANKMAMETWIEHFGKAGYFLPDTFTTPKALEVFDERFANFFMGMRHDSYEAFWFVNLVINHYRKLGINPQKKTIIFSNSLYTRPEMVALRDYLSKEFMRSMLLGKYITNRCGWMPSNTVVKLVAVKVGDSPWTDVVKLSDDPSKSIGKPEAIANCRRILRLDE